jgi:radical SAM superfamily enzyme YgiQ (UPF0313 family)
LRILLVQPENCRTPMGFRLAAMPEPLALEILAATVPGHDVRILDQRVDFNLAGMLEEFAPQVVAVTALTTEVYAAREVLEVAKAHSPEIFTAVGGHHATLLPEDFCLPYVDAVCLGEGELVFPQLIEALVAGRGLGDVPNVVWNDGEGRFTNNGRSIPPWEIDTMPLPRRDLVESYRSEYFFLFNKPDSSVATGRGCPFRCNFCSVWQFYDGRTRQMSPDRVLQEVRHVGTDHLTFVDDNFIFNARREAEIARRIKSEGIRRSYSMECRVDSIVRHPELIEQWREIGLYGVLLGLEGADDRVLKNVNKKTTSAANDEAVRILHANGVVIWGAFIVDPDWTADDFKALRDYTQRMQIGVGQFTVLTPLPGTQLYRDQYARLLTHDYTCFDAVHAVVPTRLPREEFYRHFAELYQMRDAAYYYDMVRQGAMSPQDIKRGYKMLKEMSRWEWYAETDPVLGRRDRAAVAAPG